MTGFQDIIPMFSWALFAIGLIIAATLISRFLKSIRKLRAGELFADNAEEKAAEGLWYDIGQVFRLLIYFFVILVAGSVLNYLLNSPANLSLFDVVLNPDAGFVLPIIGLTVTMYLVKMMPYLMARGMKGIGPEDEHDEFYK